jgi:hypothetical protein
LSLRGARSVRFLLTGATDADVFTSDEETNASFETATDDEGPDRQGDGPQVRVYSNISDEKHNLVLDALDRGERPIDVARWTQMNVKTGMSIKRRYELTGRRNRLPRGGARGPKLGADRVQYLVDGISENPLLTLRQMKDLLQGRFDGLRVNESTISRALDKQLISS